MNKYHFFVVYICVSRDRLLKFPWCHLILISLALHQAAATLKKTHKQLLFGDKIHKTLDEWKDNSVLANARPLTASTHVCSTVSQLFEPQMQKYRRFHVLQPTFLFPLETPLRLSRNMLHRWKDNSMFAKPLAACTYLSSIVSELYDA